MRVARGRNGLAWLAPRRLLAIQEASGERQRLLVFDPEARKVVARRKLEGLVLQLVRTEQSLALLLTRAGAIGPARVAVADRSGKVRTVRLGRILAGSKLLPTATHRVRSRIPSFAVDAEARGAVVVGQSLVAEIDLGSLAVSYHALERKPSLLSRLWNWLEPSASAKVVSGYDRQASWPEAGFWPCPERTRRVAGGSRPGSSPWTRAAGTHGR